MGNVKSVFFRKPIEKERECHMKECPFCHHEIEDWCWTCPICGKSQPAKEIQGHASSGVFEDETRFSVSDEDKGMIRDKGRMKEDDDDSLEPDQPLSSTYRED